MESKADRIHAKKGYLKPFLKAIPSPSLLGVYHKNYRRTPIPSDAILDVVINLYNFVSLTEINYWELTENLEGIGIYFKSFSDLTASIYFKLE